MWHVVKMDRTFLAAITGSPRAHALVAGVVGLAHSMELQVIAEGIETIKELSELRSLGCELGQGHFLATPVPEADLVPAQSVDPAAARRRRRSPAPVPAAG